MSKSQILKLFLSSLVIWIVGNGLLPLLPLYATQLGADTAVAGYYLAFSYLALTAGALSAGWLVQKLGRVRLPFLIAGLLSIPATWLMSRTTNIISLSIFTALLWYCGGLGLALAGILTGVSAGDMERGKIFGILSLCAGLGALIGGLSTGYAVQHWGFPIMFSGMAVFITLWPVSAFFLAEKEIKPVHAQTSAGKAPGLGRSFYLLFTASLITSITGFIVVLVRSLLMNNLHFGAMAISSTGAISGIVTLPLPFLVGWLSDRRGRKNFLYFSYLAGLISVLFLAISSLLWQFWVVIVLQSFSGSVSSPIGNALATDLLPSDSLGNGLALFSAAGWIGGILGFAGGGFALKTLGFTPTLIIGGCLTLISIGLLIPVRSVMRQPSIS